jgi:hypothetical protein
VYSDDDLTDRDIGHIEHIGSWKGKEIVYIWLPKNDERLLQLTNANLPDATTGFRRCAAIVISDKVHTIAGISTILDNRLAIQESSIADAESLQKRLRGEDK